MCTGWAHTLPLATLVAKMSSPEDVSGGAHAVVEPSHQLVSLLGAEIDKNAGGLSSQGGSASQISPGTPSLASFASSAIRTSAGCSGVNTESLFGSSIMPFTEVAMGAKGVVKLGDLQREGFKCNMCGLQKPLSELEYKGNQQWCRTDVSNYNTLCYRWRGQPKLRKWWTGLNSEQRASWFKKWQSLSTDERNTLFNFIVSTVISKELIEDDIDSWCPLDKYIRHRRLEDPTLTNKQITTEFEQKVETHKSECMYKRGQWLLPIFEGCERRSSSRTSNQIMISKSVDVHNANEMAALCHHGTGMLAEFASGIQPTRTIDPQFTANITASEHAMPQYAQPNNIMQAAISREVI